MCIHVCKHRGACMCVDLHIGACMFSVLSKERPMLGDQAKPQPVAIKDCKDFKWNPPEINWISFEIWWISVKSTMKSVKKSAVKFARKSGFIFKTIGDIKQIAYEKI